jgi:hypothetical protein
MLVTFTKKQTEQLLQLSTDSVERLVHQGRIERLSGIRAVRITIASLSRYTGMPIADLVAMVRNDPENEGSDSGAQTP